MTSKSNSRIFIIVDKVDYKVLKITFEIKHRIFIALSYNHAFFENSPTSLSLYYNGQSGLPFSFIYFGDVNSDGFDQNDLFYIPASSSDILLGAIQSGNYVPNQTMYNDLNAFIENNDYLKENRGKISERNGSRNSWRNTLDLKIRQDVALFGYGRLQFSLDILNVLNLINSEWGWDEGVFSIYPIVSLQGRLPAPDGRAVYSFSKPANNTPSAADDINSRWAMQFGIRYTFL